MSLDVYLHDATQKITPTEPGIFIREDGQTKRITQTEWNERHPGLAPYIYTPSELETDVVYTANITHNLTIMAKHAGLYGVCWHPESSGIRTAADLAPSLWIGLQVLVGDPGYFRGFNPANGWGTYEGLCQFVMQYYWACLEYPVATVEVWR